MNRNAIGIVGIILLVVLIVWLLGGRNFTCRDGTFDKNKTVIEIKK